MKLHAFSISFLFAALITNPAPASDRFANPSRTVSIPQDLSDQIMPTWSRGYLFYLGAEDGSITVYSTADDPARVALQTKMWPDAASIVRLNKAVASPSGIFAATGAWYPGSGAASPFLAFFVAGRSPTIVTLPDTGILALAFADDNTLWALVRQIDPARNELGAYNLLQHYSADGKLLGTTLSHSTFAEAASGVAYSTASLTASKDSIGIYLDRIGAWIEISPDGSIKGRWQLPETSLGPGQRLVSAKVVLTGTNEIVRVSELRTKGQRTL